MIKPGDVVTVYDDPLTRTKEEGKATVIKILSEDRAALPGKVLVRCLVRFEGESSTYGRTVFIDLEEEALKRSLPHLNRGVTA